MDHVDGAGMMKTMARETDIAKEFENNQKGCLESEENSKMVEDRCMMLEIEVEDLKKKNRELEEQIARIQKAMSNEEKGKDAIIDLTADENQKEECIQMMMEENKCLEVEKAKAESDLCIWKEKVKQLESQVCELESKLNMKGTNESSIEFNDQLLHLDKDNQVSTPKCDIQIFETGANRENCSKLRKRLSFEEDVCSNKKFAPATPGFAPPPSVGVVNISDEDIDEDDDMAGFRRGKRKRCSNIIASDDEDETDTNISKRKSYSNIVTSDDETSYDDNAPISTLIKNNNKNEVMEDVSRQPLKRLRKSHGITNDRNKRENSSSEDVEDDDDDDDDDDDHLGGFIVESPEPENENEFECGSGDTDRCDESEIGLDEYKETIAKIGRKKDFKRKWELEADMLADFGKDPELCMRAVCALYRQQTEDEKACKGTIYHNERGFSQIDANRGCEVAEFLTDGDPNGDLNKTVEELKRYNSEWVELCMQLATKYSKQLFQIYQNKEDPYLLP